MKFLALDYGLNCIGFVTCVSFDCEKFLEESFL